MSWRRLGLPWVVVTLVALTLLAVVLQTGGRGPAGASSLSRGPAGWLAARLWLERQGVEVGLLDRELARAPAHGTLVVAFPWSSLALPREADPGQALLRRLEAGGDLLLAYSGRRSEVREEEVLATLGLPPVELREPPSLVPWEWLRHAREEWRLSAEPEFAPLRPLVLGARDVSPESPAASRALFRAPGGRPLVFTYRAAVGREGSSGGRVAVVPSAALANARLAAAGNGDLLRTLRGWLREPWIFDEHHHGLVAPAAEEVVARGWVFDLLLVHLIALYLAAVTALARRFGPPWRQPPVIAGSSAAFFLGLGALHHRRGHHAEGARRLLERVEELDGEPPLPPDQTRGAATADGATFLDLARRVAERRSGSAA